MDMDTAAIYQNNCACIPCLLMSGIKTCLVYNDVSDRKPNFIEWNYCLINVTVIGAAWFSFCRSSRDQLSQIKLFFLHRSVAPA